MLSAHAALLGALWTWRIAPSHAPHPASTPIHFIAVAPRPTAPSDRPARPSLPRSAALATPPPAEDRSAPAAPAGPAPAAESGAITLPPPSAAAAPASSPLNLTLPPSFRGEGPMVPARQAQADPRANSPRPSLGEQVFGTDGGATLRVETQSGAQIRGPQGSCTQVTNNTWAQMNPMDPNARALPSKVHDCSKLAPGAARHARPK